MKIEKKIDNLLMANFSENSWRVEKVSEGDYDVHTRYDEKDTGDFHLSVTHEEEAYLISSAPEMLSILKKIEPILRCLILDGHMKDPKLRKSIMVESEDHMRDLRCEMGHAILRAEGTYRDCIGCGLEVASTEWHQRGQKDIIRCKTCWDKHFEDKFKNKNERS